MHLNYSLFYIFLTPDSCPRFMSADNFESIHTCYKSVVVFPHVCRRRFWVGGEEHRDRTLQLRVLPHAGGDGPGSQLDGAGSVRGQPSVAPQRSGGAGHPLQHQLHAVHRVGLH
jgi:hypothetical protein